MKKLFLIALTLVMTLNLAACGAEPVTLVDVTTEQGISLKLPSDITHQENSGYTNTKKSDVVTFGVIEAGETPLSEITEEEFFESELSNYQDVAITSFENNKPINGIGSLICKFTFTTSKGIAVANALVMIPDGDKEYVVNFIHTTDNTEGSLAKNLQACIDSITVKSAE